MPIQRETSRADGRSRCCSRALVEAAGIRVTWPGGRVDTIGPVKANQRVVIKEGAGLVKSTALTRSK